MDNFNKVISFVLGLIVVIVLLVIITGRLNIRERFLSLVGKSKPFAYSTVSPTPTQREKNLAQLNTSITPTRIPTITDVIDRVTPTPTRTVTLVPKITTIPRTGAPTILLALAPIALAAGTILRKTK